MPRRCCLCVCVFPRSLSCFFLLDGSQSSCCFESSLGRKCCGPELFGLCCLISCPFWSSVRTRVSLSSPSRTCVWVFAVLPTALVVSSSVELAMRCAVRLARASWLDRHPFCTYTSAPQPPHINHHQPPPPPPTTTTTTTATSTQNNTHNNTCRLPARVPFVFRVTSTNNFMFAAASAANATGAAQRRQRRLKQFLQHERLSVAMALAESQHLTRSEDGKGRERGARGARRVTTTEAPSSPGVLPVDEEEDAELGARPRSVTDPVPQGRVGAAHRGAQDRGVPVRSDPRCYCAADEGSGGGTASSIRGVNFEVFSQDRVQQRLVPCSLSQNVHDPVFRVGGSRRSSRFSCKTEFNSSGR